jgi:hypothetical protein
LYFFFREEIAEEENKRLRRHVMKYLAMILKWKPVGPEAKFLDEIQTKVLRVFTVTSTAFYFFKLMQTLTVSTVQLLYTVSVKGGKPDRKPYPLPYGYRNS